MICIYHDECFDGLAAAWSLRRLEMNPKDIFMPCAYGTEPDLDQFIGQRVYIVDFSFPPQYLLKLCAVAEYVVVMDHHETAIRKIDDYFAERPIPANLDLKLDTTLSGVGIVWDRCMSGIPMPPLFQAAQDQDLWRFELPHTREIMAFVFCHPLTFESIDTMIDIPVSEMIVPGHYAIEKTARMIEYHKRHVSTIELEGYMVPIVNAPRYIASNVAEELYTDQPFVIVWHDTATTRKYSLRSKRGVNSVNVALIAEKHGGGGHHNAASFERPLPTRL